MRFALLFGWLGATLLLNSPVRIDSQLTSLAGDRFKTSHDVEGWANLALDIAAMRDSDDNAKQREIYEQGLYANYTDSNGNLIKLTLASLSTDAYPKMKEDPLYNYFRHAFSIIGNQDESEKLGDFDQQPVEQYANTLVIDLFKLTVPFIEAEAALVVVVWMYIVHQFEEILRLCQNQAAPIEMNHELDIAAALYVGVGQPLGDFEQGNMLYNLVQVRGRSYGQDKNGEVLANKRVMDGMVQLQTLITSNICATAADAYVQLRTLVNKLHGAMTIGLVQNLIHHILQQPAPGGSDFIELYALSIAPRVRVCNPAAYEKILNSMVFGEVKEDDASTNSAIALVRSTFDCLGITCEEVGSYETGELDKCTDPKPTDKVNLAEYSPTFNMNAYARLDRDALMIRTLTVAGAPNAALDIYTHGYNSLKQDGKYLTWFDLASSEKNTADAALATAYFGGRKDYSDDTIRKALAGQAPFAQASTVQRAEIVVGTLAYSVAHINIVQMMHDALATCTAAASGFEENAARLWDQAVALYVGSIEGTQVGGQVGGKFLYGAAKSVCNDFDTCLESGNAKINNDLLFAFTTANSELRLGDCNDVQKLMKTEIGGGLLVPMLQGALHTKAVISELSAKSTNSSIGTGHAFVEAVLPFVNAADANSAAVLVKNLEFITAYNDPVQGGPKPVFDALRSALPKMTTDCGDVGLHQAGNLGGVCPGNAGSPTTAPVPTSAPVVSPTPAPTPTPEPTPAVPTPAPTLPPVPAGPAVLGFGRYVFESDVTGLSKIAHDIRDMQKAADIAAAKAIYSNGKNAQVVENGITKTVAVAEYSLTAATYMAQDPVYNFFRYALLNETVFGDGSLASDSAFGDTIVQKAFSVADDNRLAAEASVVSILWMEISHHLYEALRLCKKKIKATDELDKALALWLGADQPQASAAGFLMYSVAQSAANVMGRGSGEARPNTQLITLFGVAKGFTDKCAQDSQGSLAELRGIVTEIHRVMSIPLLQRLMEIIHLAKETDMTNELELYALSIIPHGMACNPGVFFGLEDVFLDIDYDWSDVFNDGDFYFNMLELQKCLRITCDDIMDGEIKDQALRATVEDYCYTQPNEGDFISIAGYNATEDVEEYLRLDKDVLQIGILMETRAYEAAMDFYVFGQNSRHGDTLKRLATAPNRVDVPQFNLFKDYFEADANYADSIIMDAIQQQGNFILASRQQLTEIVVSTLQSMVSYMDTLRNLYEAVKACRSGGDSPALYWDQAVAVFVGSIEGEQKGGDLEGYGQMMYALGKDVCERFNTCESNGDSSTNEALIRAFKDGSIQIGLKKCDVAETIITDRILPAMPVSLVQQTLYLSTVLEELEVGTTDEALGTGYAMSRSLVPLVKAANPVSASKIDHEMDFQLERDPVQDGSEAIFAAITNALVPMGVGCSEIGTFTSEDGSIKDRGVCPADTETRPNPPDSPTTLGEGLYTATTAVQHIADIALDFRAIRNSLEGNSPDLAQKIYEDGENSAVYDEKGVRVGSLSVQSFSTTAAVDMKEEPVYNIFLYGLRDDNGKYLGRDVDLYADSIVQAAFKNTNPSSKLLAADAMLSLNLWMFLAHELYETLDNCKNERIVDNDGIKSIDEAAALYIGALQITGSPDEGHLLYAHAEKTAELFNSDEKTGQSRVNRNILRLFNQAKLEVSFPDSCSDPNTFPRLRQIVTKIISWMVVPLMQSLIDAIETNDRDRVQLYAQAYVPLVAGCSPSAHAYLSEKLISLTYNVAEIKDIRKRIESTYECLGLRCEDIGVYKTDTAESCVDTRILSPLAGYRPETNVRAHARLDLDTLNANIFMTMGALEATKDLYMYGQHSVVEGLDGPVTLSFHKLATTSRTEVPQFEAFKQYFNSEGYADVIIQRALDPAQLPGASQEQRRGIVVKSMQFMILYMEALELMYEAVAGCESSDKLRLLDAQEAWDRSAAILIGSLEGPDNGGSADGQFLYSLARNKCKDFNSCGDFKGNAVVNEQIISLLYTGRGTLSGRSCSALRKGVREMEPLLLVPLIQATLGSALANEKLRKGTTDKGLAEGYVFSHSVLPLVDDVNRKAAEKIKHNMDFQFDRKPVVDGAKTVFKEFSKVYGGMGVDCELVGKTGSFDACTGATRPGSGGGGADVGLIVGLVLGALGFAGLGFVYWKKKRKIKQLDAQPEFVASANGELNHTSDLLAEKSLMGDSKTAASSQSGPSVDLEAEISQMEKNNSLHID